MAKRLTAKQLGITSEERKALIKVRDGLASGKFIHRKEPRPDKPTGKPIFNMRIIHKSWECGTAACIAGWMSTAMDRNPEDFFDENGALGELFAPEHIPYSEYENLTPKQAVRAIDNFLETGTDKPWARRKRAA